MANTKPSGQTGYVDIYLGLQWGDEGKGKIVDYFAKDYDIVARFQGGPNAGHTLWYKQQKLILHNLPSGILHDRVKNFIGPGCVVNPVTLLAEIRTAAELLGVFAYEMQFRIFISHNTFIIHPLHQFLDKAIECSKGNNSVGTTGKGIGPAYADIKDRIAFRFGDFELTKDFFSSPAYVAFVESVTKELEFYADEYGYSVPEITNINQVELEFKNAIRELLKCTTFVDTFWLEAKLRDGQNVLAEGAQGTMLDNNFGCYPMVTSSNTVAGTAPVGLGVPMKYFRKTVGIAKWYTTKVGSGEFPSEIKDEEIQALLQEAGQEVGATTGRKRRCGWFDIPQIRYALQINGVDELIITKVDINPLQEVEIVNMYKVNGEGIKTFPFSIDQIEAVSSFGLNMKWSLEEGVPLLETDLRLYLGYINDQVKNLGVTISHISYGPNRDDVIEVNF